MHRRLRSPRPLALVISLFALSFAAPAAAQTALTLSTPFPGVSVQPGATATFTITVGAAEAVRADLAVEGAPEGWTATLRGGGYEVRSVQVNPAEPPTVTLDVAVPDDAPESDETVTLTATGGGETATLALDIHVAAQAGGTVSMEADFPTLQGTVDQTFSFSLNL